MSGGQPTLVARPAAPDGMLPCCLRTVTAGGPTTSGTGTSWPAASPVEGGAVRPGRLDGSGAAGGAAFGGELRLWGGGPLRL